MKQSPAEIAAEFTCLREANLIALKKVGQADLLRKARHSELVVVSLGELLYEWVAHSLNHTVQAEKALMQPFIAGSGAWQVYFKDRDMEAKLNP